MRSLLMSILLLIVIVVLYENTIGGNAGALRKLELRGNQVNIVIEGIDP